MYHNLVYFVVFHWEIYNYKWHIGLIPWTPRSVKCSWFWPSKLKAVHCASPRWYLCIFCYSVSSVISSHFSSVQSGTLGLYPNCYEMTTFYTNCSYSLKKSDGDSNPSVSRHGIHWVGVKWGQCHQMRGMLFSNWTHCKQCWLSLDN